MLRRSSIALIMTIVMLLSTTSSIFASSNNDYGWQVSSLEDFTFEILQVQMFERNFKTYANYQSWESYYYDFEYAYDKFWDKKMDYYNLKSQIQSDLRNMEEIHQILGNINYTYNEERFTEDLVEVLSIGQALYVLSKTGPDAEYAQQLIEAIASIISDLESDELTLGQAIGEVIALSRNHLYTVRAYEDYYDRLDDAQSTFNYWYNRLMDLPEATYRP